MIGFIVFGFSGNSLVWLLQFNKISKLEKEIRKNNLDYECFECKAKFSVNETKCPECSFVTLYGKRKGKFWVVFLIIGVWIFLVAKFLRGGII